MTTPDQPRRATAYLVFLAVAACLVAPESLVAQTVHYGAQQRRIGALDREEYFQNDPPDYVTRSDSKEATAPDLGPFDAAVSANAGGYSSISQHSSLRPDGISTSGDWSTYAATDEGVFSFGTLTDATFDVLDAPVAFTFTYFLRDPSHRGYAREVDLFLRRTDGGGADVFRVVPRYDPDLYTASGTDSGVLSPGRYQFQYFSSYLGDVGEFGRYDVQLTFSGLPEPASIGFVLLGGALAVRRRRRG